MEIDIIGVPIDFGAGRRGVDMGPSAIRYAELEAALIESGYHVFDQGNIEVPIQETCQINDPRLRFIDCIVPICRRVMSAVASSIGRGRLPIVLGGDHSLSLGSIRGAARRHNLGVIWLDAHADFNTHETSPSGNIHGMPLAALCGLGDFRLVNLEVFPQAEPHPVLNPRNTVIVGARDIDPGEQRLLRENRVNVFTMHDIDRQGMAAVMEQSLQIALNGTEGLYLSLDLDAIDPLYAPGVGTPVYGGLTYREVHLACEMIAESKKIIAMDFVEVNTILDEQNKTARMAVELILSALGKRIW
jgi:arginase